ncbi:MAG: hypothetical protein IJ037_05245 [Clostridia bacterium]|nr:hypothetical protein [Clostridia bacterium]
MKKLLILLSAILLTSCGTQTMQTYSNMNLYCQLGDTLYLNDRDIVLNGALDTVISLCRDPLCSHDDYDSTCPESPWFAAQEYYQTDGERIFMYVNDIRPGIELLNETGSSAQFRTIYSFLPLESEMRKIAEFESLGQLTGLPFMLSGDYVYFKQNHYLDADARTDEVFRLMRVKKTGGKPEEVLERDIPVSVSIAVSGSRIYLSDTAGDGACEIVDMETGITETAAPEGKRVQQVCVQEDTVYFFCDGTVRTDSAGTEFVSTDIYRYEDSGGFTLIAQDVWNARFSGGALWISPASLTYYGTAELPTGRGNEIEMTDIYDRDTGELIRLDPVTGEKQSWTTDRHIDFLGYSAGYALARLVDYVEYLETGVRDNTIYKLTLNDDGTVTIAGTIDEVN